MKKVLIAVDDTKGSKHAFSMSRDICACLKPESVTLVYVEKFEGRSLIDEMLGDAEMSTLREVLQGTEYQAALDRKARAILKYYEHALQSAGVANVRTVIRRGHPVEEILKAATDEGSEMIIIGSRGRRTSHVFMGSVSREVANNSEIPVLIAK